MVLATLTMQQFSCHCNNCFWSFNTASFTNYPVIEKLLFLCFAEWLGSVCVKNNENKIFVNAKPNVDSVSTNIYSFNATIP